MSGLNPSSGIAIGEISVFVLLTLYGIYRLEKASNAPGIGTDIANWWDGISTQINTSAAGNWWDNFWGGFSSDNGTYPVWDPRNPNYDPTYNPQRLSPGELAQQIQEGEEMYYSHPGTLNPITVGPTELGIGTEIGPQAPPTRPSTQVTDIGTVDVSSQQSEWEIAASEWH